MSDPPFSFDATRYDMKTWAGRTMHFLAVINPAYLVASGESIKVRQFPPTCANLLPDNSYHWPRATRSSEIARRLTSGEPPRGRKRNTCRNKLAWASDSLRQQTMNSGRHGC